MICTAPTNDSSGSDRSTPLAGTEDRRPYRFTHPAADKTNRPGVAPNHFSSRAKSSTDHHVAAGHSVSERPRSHSRGRLLIPLLLLLAVGGSGIAIWDSLFRYQAYGVVTGKLIAVSAPIDGILQSVQVLEGEAVRQQQCLATIRDLEGEHQLSRIDDKLRIAQATLAAEVARLQWAFSDRSSETLQAAADYHLATGQIHEDESQLKVLQDQLGRMQKLKQASAVGGADLQATAIRESAQLLKLSETRRTVEVLKLRAEKLEGAKVGSFEQIEPLLARTEMLLNEAGRLRERTAQGEVRMPVNGSVLRRHRPTGECIRAHETLFTVVEESSLEIELFLTQARAHEYSVGDHVHIKLEPFDELVPCVVTFAGQEHRRPPEQLESYYRPKTQLVPFRLRPLDPQTANDRFRIGAVARLPRLGAHSSRIF